MSIISCVFFKSYYYFIVYWILDLLDEIEKDYFESKFNNFNNSSNVNNTNKTNSDYIENGREIDILYIGLLSIADMSAGFLVAFTFIRMKCLKENKEESSKAIDKPSYELIYNDPSIIKNKYSLILLTSVLDVLARGHELLYFLFVNLYRLDYLKSVWVISIDIFSRILFCKYFLKTNLYSHHIISIIILSIGLLINAIYGMMALDSKYDWIYVLFLIISRILFALADTINKILLTKKFLLAHYLMFLRGLFSFIIILFLFLILCLTSKIDTGYYEYIILYHDFALEILRKIVLIIFSFFKVFCIFRIIYIFSPQHVGFCNIISVYIKIIKYLIKFKVINNVTHFIFDMISLLFIFLGTIIFNEMIIVNIFGLNENTKAGKIKKELLDNERFNSTIVNENENEMDNENEYNKISIEDIKEKE